MPTPNHARRSFYAALLLGTGSAALSLLRWSTPLQGMEQLSLLALFIAAGATGVRGAIIALSIGLLPLTLTSIPPLEALRTCVETLAIGLLADKRPRLPQFVGAAAGAILFFASFRALDFLGGLRFSPHWTIAASHIFRDVVMAMVSGALLLNRGLWAILTRRARLASLNNLLAHVLGIVACLSLALPLAMLGAGSIIPPNPESPEVRRFAALLLLALAAPAALGWHLGSVIMRDRRKLFGTALEKHENSFSGLSSDYWRRKAKDREETYEPPRATNRGQKAAESEDVGILALNRAGTVTFLNQKFRDMIGGIINDAAGRDISRIGLPPELAQKLLAFGAEALLDGARSAEFKINQLPNPIRFLEISAGGTDPLDSIWPSKESDTVIFKVRDITDRRTVEAHLLQGQRLASLGSLVSGFAHSLNNSLTAIAGHASCAAHVGEAEAIRENINGVLTAAAQAGETVNKLIEFAEGKPSLMRQENIEQAIEKSLGLLKSAAGVNHEIEFEITSTPTHVVCDWNLVVQALSNVILNARDSYAENRGKIRIELGHEYIDKELAGLMPGASPGEFARIRVKDSGEGMSADVLKHACEPLFTTRSASGHSGLGLSIVYAIVRAHDGFLTVESKPDKGTTVSIYLPAAVYQKTESADYMQAEDGRNNTKMADLYGNKEKILVVEDEPKVRELISIMLSTIGYTVTSCGNGEEALNRCATADFDLVLVDMIMPRMSGLEFLSKMRDSEFSAKALIMTGYGVTKQSADSGAGVISKPFDISTLARAVKGVLAEAEDAPKAEPIVLN